jgi:hypothetical protein
MIENIKLATKAEIQKEMEILENKYKERETLLKEKFEEMKLFVEETDKINRELSEQYKVLKTEMNKREGKGN